jgi:hypothetical protein
MFVCPRLSRQVPFGGTTVPGHNSEVVCYSVRSRYCKGHYNTDHNSMPKLILKYSSHFRRVNKDGTCKKDDKIKRHRVIDRHLMTYSGPVSITVHLRVRSTYAFLRCETSSEKEYPSALGPNRVLSRVVWLRHNVDPYSKQISSLIQ